MNAHMAGRERGAALKSLSREQIRALVLLAREAWGRGGAGQGFDEWRHQQCLLTVERGGLTECRNEDYLPLKAHFLRLLGRAEEAAAAETRHAMEPRTWAFHNFQLAMQAATDAAFVARERLDAYAYAGGFLRRTRGVATFDEADTKAVWAATYLLQRKAAQLRKRAETAAARDQHSAAVDQEVPF
jgi:hypothetical protein